MEQSRISKEYAILVINTKSEQGQAASSLLKSLYERLRQLSQINESKVSIHTETSPNKNASSITVVESNDNIKRYFIQEFFFPRSQGLPTKAFINWIIQTPRRISKYFNCKLQEIRDESIYTHQRITGLVRLLWQSAGYFLDVLIFAFLLPMMAILVIRPLRRISSLATVFYLFAFISLFILISWKWSLSYIILWISQFTNQLVSLTASSGVTFEMLFPIVAGVMTTVALSVIAIFVQIARWLVSRLSYPPEGYPEINAGFEYLLNPIYSAEVRDKFENQIIEWNNTPTIQRIFVICQGIGGLLSYEVLSNICKIKITKPVYLVTHDLLLAGFPIAPFRSSLWQWIESSDWIRFSVTTPDNLSWHHITPWPAGEYTFKLTSRPQIKLPLVEEHIEKKRRWQPVNTVLIDSLIYLLA